MGSINSELAFGELGGTLPPNNIHAISVSLPTWEATIGWVSKDPAVVRRMQTGYPRFFIHRYIDELAGKIARRYQEDHNLYQPDSNSPALHCMLFPSAYHSDKCEEFLKRNNICETQKNPIKTLNLGLATIKTKNCFPSKQVDWANLELYAVIFPLGLLPIAKSFWQHTGFGISSRYAHFYLKRVDGVLVRCSSPCERCKAKKVEKLTREHELDQLTSNHLPSVVEDLRCKSILGQRLANLHPKSSKIMESKDIFIYSTGMCAFTNLANASWEMRLGNSCEFVCYGFLYVDIFKVLEKVLGIKTTLYGHASTSDLDDLEHSLRKNRHIIAVVVEIPQNPLLGSPDLCRLKRLANEFNFLFIVDDTIGTPVNVNILPQVDVIVTSLSKMFSGACDVMGGAITLNPDSPFASRLRNTLSSNYIDTYFPLDAAIMEFNSRDFVERVIKASKNAEVICDLLRFHESTCVQTVYYPKGSPTQKFYDWYRKPDGGYGYLLSVIFKRPAQAISFFDALDVAKGPSLGTNFTLSCPYTLLAHYKELEWAAKYGLQENLVRISVGLEDLEILKSRVKAALEAAEQAGT
ncbi:pyridoxal phosphate-dependent transferase [Tricladium varicosporioides]|nr:pyridoxal phosphate-dependent transferase [Hymenoscyphus varicosporioides]